MRLSELGFTADLESFRRERELESLLVGRVTVAHRERYVVLTEHGEFEAELLGNLRYSVAYKSDLPSVGDWVALSEYDEGRALVHVVYPRFSVLERASVGKAGEKQIIATNIDVGLLVQSVNRDFSLNRLERYLTICYSAKITPIVVITKIDLMDESEVQELLSKVKERISDVEVIAVSNASQVGMDELRSRIQSRKTYCLLGSSGVGKSSLINSLSGEVIMKTGSISDAIDRGKHVTTHRELILLKNGAILIDNPGMREVGIADSSEGLENTFDSIYELAEECQFSDCSHAVEKGCAILEALESGTLTKAIYDNYMKMGREQAHYESTVAERRKKDKEFGKLVKNVIKKKDKRR